MDRIRSHVTYASVISTLVLFLVLGGSAYDHAGAQPAKSATRGRTQTAAIKARFIGTWRLRSESVHDANGNIVGHLFGENGVGKLTYTKRGDVWAFVGRRDRQSALWYIGSFDVRPTAHQVVHHVQYSSATPFEGTDLVRRYRFHGDERLTLSFSVGGGQRDVLDWKQ
jgi:Lipocalin-like domain